MTTRAEEEGWRKRTGAARLRTRRCGSRVEDRRRRCRTIGSSVERARPARRRAAPRATGGGIRHPVRDLHPGGQPPPRVKDLHPGGSRTDEKIMRASRDGISCNVVPPPPPRRSTLPSIRGAPRTDRSLATGLTGPTGAKSLAMSRRNEHCRSRLPSDPTKCAAVSTRIRVEKTSIVIKGRIAVRPWGRERIDPEGAVEATMAPAVESRRCRLIVVPDVLRRITVRSRAVVPPPPPPRRPTPPSIRGAPRTGRS
jgi:hypothetical protein